MTRKRMASVGILFFSNGRCEWTAVDLTPSGFLFAVLASLIHLTRRVGVPVRALLDSRPDD